MVKIDRKVWLMFDIVGIALIIAGAVMYTGIIVRFDSIVSEGVFLMGFFFVVFGAIFGYIEGVSMRNEVMEISRSKKVEDDIESVSDDSGEPYIFDMEESWNEPVEEETFNSVLSDTSED